MIVVKKIFYAKESYIYDVNRDGAINLSDVKLVLDYIGRDHGKIEIKLTGFHLLYDVNCDGTVSIIDAESINNNRD